ncbi:hypothetical protein H271_11150 [Vibrio parahaemolyticus 1911C]|nr:hypothetical protein H271_11150 [Vibrio parahaemolyticus 1911C]
MCYEVIGDSNTKVIAIKALKRKVIYGGGGKFGGNNAKDSVKVENGQINLLICCLLSQLPDYQVK